jgi:hypothetical protein
MLEGIIQSLSAELDDKKRLLKQLTTSSGGANDAATVSRAVGAAGNDVAVLKSLLEKSMNETNRVKQDMRIIGDELSKAQEKLRSMANSEKEAPPPPQATSRRFRSASDDE